jgi:threonine/homoserine/homoserine lactone efflux protein
VVVARRPEASEYSCYPPAEASKRRAPLRIAVGRGSATRYLRESAAMGLHLTAFLGIAAIVIITPGPDTALVTKNALLYGRRPGIATAFGVTSGLLVWTFAAALGVAAVVHASATAFTVMKLVGAAYLIWLGIQALRAAGHRVQADEQASERRRLDVVRGFRQGLINDLANPKIAAFFTSLLPQFIDSGQSVLAPFLVLGALFAAITLAWLIAFAAMASKAGGLLTRPRVKAGLDRLTGVVLIALGLRLATERR